MKCGQRDRIRGLPCYLEDGHEGLHCCDTGTFKIALPSGEEPNFTVNDYWEIKCMECEEFGGEGITLPKHATTVARAHSRSTGHEVQIQVRVIARRLWA